MVVTFSDICHPTPADIVFVLDSSLSMLEHQFRKQLQFVANFTDHVQVGPRDFQISVITFSTDARIEFYLNDYTDNITLKEALGRIQFKPGVTFTDKGLSQVCSIFVCFTLSTDSIYLELHSHVKRHLQVQRVKDNAQILTANNIVVNPLCSEIES